MDGLRVAALYDIHGNLPALEAVLADVEDEDADLVVAGGDMLLGPMPAETLARLRALGDRFLPIRGNTERAILEPASGDDVWARRARWAHEQLSEGDLALLAALPETAVVEVEGLGPTLFCHGSPRSDEEIVTRATPPERLSEMLTGVSQELIVLGHTHIQFDRLVGATRVVNAGSVGMPYEGEPGAYWAHLGPEVDLRRTAYDVEAAADRVRATGVPGADELAAENVLVSADPDEATEFFERMAAERAG